MECSRTIAVFIMSAAEPVVNLRHGTQRVLSLLILHLLLVYYGQNSVYYGR
jgi:cytochrome c1